MANRNSDVVLWDTSNLPAQTYYVYATVDSNSFLAPGPVVVDSGYSDATAPVLQVDAPLAGHVFQNSLEFAGYAIDNVRLAAVEVFIDTPELKIPRQKHRQILFLVQYKGNIVKELLFF